MLPSTVASTPVRSSRASCDTIKRQHGRVTTGASRLAATIRYFLERVLDTHQIELQDAMLNSRFADDTFDPMSLPSITQIDKPKHSTLIPTVHLVDKAATALYGIRYSIDGVPSLTDTDRLVLMDFVNVTFAAFLSHVRTVLLERSLDEEDDDEEKEVLSRDGRDKA